MELSGEPPAESGLSKLLLVFNVVREPSKAVGEKAPLADAGFHASKYEFERVDWEGEELLRGVASPLLIYFWTGPPRR